jgi:hypothetical protein
MACSVKWPICARILVLSQLRHDPRPVLLKGIAARIPVMGLFELTGQFPGAFIRASRPFTDAGTCGKAVPYLLK